VQMQPAYLHCQQAEAKDCRQFERRRTHGVMISDLLLSDHRMPIPIGLRSFEDRTWLCGRRDNFRSMLNTMMKLFCRQRLTAR
jgi:hypothetical protein